MQIFRTKFLRTRLILLSCAMINGKHATALDIHWNGSGGLFGNPESWQNVDNWDPAGSPFQVHRVPTDVDTANLLTPVVDIVRLYADTAPINGLIVSSGIELYTNGFLLEVDNAGSANSAVGGGAQVNVEPNANGLGFRTDALLVASSQAGLFLEGGDALVEGNTVMLTRGRVEGYDGGTIHFGGDVNIVDGILRMFDRATAEFTPNTTLTADNGSIIDLDHRVNINDGITFDLKSGVLLQPQSLNIGNNGVGVGSVGTLLLDGAGRTDVTVDLTVGHATDGVGLIQAKDSVVISVREKVTVHPTGAIELDNTQLEAGGNLLVDGGTVTSVNQYSPIFLPVGGTATATNGGIVFIHGSQEIFVDGTFEFNTGADLTVTGDMLVGTHGTLASTNNRLNIDGAGSTLNVGANLVVGEEQIPGAVMLSADAVGNVGVDVEVGSDGVGTLTIESGATLAGADGRIGGSAASEGTVLVHGAGSSWNSTESLAIGLSGMGELHIEAGGRVTSASSFVAADTTSTGTVTVSGADSTWAINGALSLGQGQLAGVGGQATLKVQTGGAVNVGTTIAVYANDLLRLEGGTMAAETLDLQGGTFDWTAGTLHLESSLDGIVNKGGRLAPGTSTPGDEIGNTVIDGNYIQQTGGTLAFDIGGSAPITQYDQVSVTGSALLDGELELQLLNGYVPMPTDTFSVFSALGGIAGVLDNITTGGRLETLDGAGSFLVHYGPGSPFDDHQIVLSSFQLNSADTEPDGDVDGADFLAIQRTNSALIPLWASQFGNGTPLGASQAVPEPHALALLLLALACVIRRSALVGYDIN